MVDLLRAQVKHAMLGIGTVTQQDANYITVQFVNKTSRFAYPAAFETYLVPEDPNLEHAIRAEIDAAEAAEAAREAAESARILEEERARLATTQESFSAPHCKSNSIPAAHCQSRSAVSCFSGNHLPGRMRRRVHLGPKIHKGWENHAPLGPLDEPS